MPCKSTKTHPPTVYACRKSDMMLGRWNSQLGAAVRRYGPSIWDGIPTPALLSLGANSEGTGSCVVSAGFYEVGAYDTPAGTVVPGDATCANAGRGGTWVRLGNSALFVSLVGRSISSNWRSDITGQAVVGMMDYAENSAGFRSRLAPAGMAPTRGSQWDYAIGAMGYVNGADAVIRFIVAHPELARVPEQLRFGALARLAASASSTEAPGVSVCYPIVRAWERLFCGWILSARLGMNTDFYAVGLGRDRAEIEYQLTRRWVVATGCADEGRPDPRYYASCSGVPTGGTGGSFMGSNGSSLQSLAMAGLLAYGAYRVSQGRALL